MLLSGLVAVALWAPPGCGRPLAPSRDASRQEVVVARVVDGDTISLSDGRAVRYLGIDTPEYGEAGHREAREANRRALAAGTVNLETFASARTDNHGRLLGVVRVRDAAAATERCVNVELVASGLAWVYQKNEGTLPAPFRAALLNAQLGALEREVGVWKRLRAVEAGRPDLVSTRFRVHRATCRHVRNFRPRRVESLRDELRNGKSPCRSCKPLR